MLENTLKEFYSDYQNDINDSSLEFVFGFGAIPCEIILIGEAPGKDEVRLGRPFVGKAGQILSSFLSQAGVDRDSLYITNAIKYRLSRPGKKIGTLANRPAKSEEIKVNSKYLAKEIEIIKPIWVVTLGNIPLKCILQSTSGNIGNISIGEAHGKIFDCFVGSTSFKLFPLYHPASIIYNRALKEVYEQDLMTFKEIRVI